MKKNTLKRMMAGSLALLTVAAYVPVSAIELVPARDAIVANAAITRQRIYWDESSNYMTKLQYGSGATDFLSAGDIAGGSSYNTVVGNQVTITSKVPLEITPRNQRYVYALIDDDTQDVPVVAEQYNHTWVYHEAVGEQEEYFTKGDDNTPKKASDVLEDIKKAITDELKLDFLHDWYFSDAEGEAIHENDVENGQAVTGESVIDDIKKGGTSLYYTVVTYQKSDDPVIDQAYFDAIPVDIVTKYAPITNDNGEITSFTSDNKTLTVDEVKEALLKDKGYYDTDVLKDSSSFYTATGEEVKLVSEEGVEPELQPCGFTKNTLYLLVGFSYTATAENDGTYSYNFTMPDAELDVTPTTSDIDLSFFESNEKKAADDAAFAANSPTTPYSGDTNRWGKEDDGFADYWKDLTFGTVDEDFDIEDVHPDDEQVIDGIQISKSYELDDQVIGTEMTVSCSNPFTLKINDQNDKQNWITPEITYNTTAKRFQAKFIVPASASKERLVEFQFIKVDEEYTFTEKGTQLLATTKTGSITNATVADLNVEYFANQEDVATIGTDGDKGTVVPSTAIKNGNWIAFTANCADENGIVSDNGNGLGIAVKKDGKDVTKYTDQTADDVYYKEIKDTNDKIVGYTIFNLKNGNKVAPKGGTYTVSYKVTETVGKTPQAHTLTKSFTIAAKDSLKAEDVTLTISATKDNVALKQDELAALLKPNEETSKKGKTDGVTSFMLANGKSQEVDEAGYQFTITPTIEGLTYGSDFKAFKRVSGSERNTVYTIEIRVYDAEYGGSASNPKTFNVQWSVKDFEDDAKFKDFGTVTVAAEDVETLEDKVFDAAAENDPAKALKNQVEYLYVDGHNGAKLANGAEIELDNYSDGLPSEIGEYTVYVLYDGVVVSQGNVTITAHGVKFAPAAEDLSLTYGKQLDFSDFTLTDASGEAPKNVTAEEIKVQVGYVLEEGAPENKTTRFVSFKLEDIKDVADANSDQAKVEAALKAYAKDTLKIADENKQAEYAKAVLNDLVAFNEVDTAKLADMEEFLDAGVYAVQFAVKSSDEAYAITSEVSTLTVSKKKISDPSVQITIDPIQWDGEAHNIVTEIKNNQCGFYAKDTQTGEKIENFLKVTEGETVADVNNYQAKVKVVDGTNWNYEGTTTAKWNIVYKINKENLNTGLAWAEKMTTLYDNGRIHLEINRNANDKFLPNGTSIVIEEYGVVYENSAKIAPPVKYARANNVNGEYVTTDGMTEEQIETQLQLGNGYGEGAYTTTTSYTAMGNTTFKGNFRVKSVDVGIWARPYILLKDTKTGEKTVVYGDIKYVNLEEEAKTRLNLQMNMAEPYSPAVREADLTDAQRKDIATKVKLIKGGYDPSKNRYYAYATFEDLETAGFGDVLQVTDFGVVLDSQGNIPADDGTDELKEEVKKTMLISNKKLKVGHYSKDNKVLKYNEFAANIKPKDSVTGIWVRPYLDLGNDLIVYGDPQYVTDVSSYFNGVNNEGATFDAVPQVTATWRCETNNQDIPVYDGSVSLNGTKDKYSDALTAVEGKVKAVPAANKDTTTVTLVKVGTIADKYEALYTLNDKGEAAYDDAAKKAYYTGLQAVDATKAKAAGFNYGTKSGATVLGDNNSGYKGRITPVHATFTGDDAHTPVTYGKDLVVRQFAVYEIKVGTEEAFQVTVYGDIRQFVCNDVFNQATKFGSTYENIDVRQ